MDTDFFFRIILQSSFMYLAIFRSFNFLNMTYFAIIWFVDIIKCSKTDKGLEVQKDDVAG